MSFTIPEFREEEFDLDLFLRCMEDAGAKITKGTGKFFVDGKETNFSDALADFLQLKRDSAEKPDV